MIDGSAAAELITASVSPVATDAPTAIGSSATLPALCAVISFSIFIASITADQRALLHRGARLDGDLQDRALNRRGERVATAAAAARTLARARGAAAPPRAPRRRRRRATPPPPNGGPITLTSKRLPETSTV